jgi:hypothetical protein
VLDLPPDKTVEGNTAGGWSGAYAATATDVEDDPDPAAVCDPAAHTLFPLGATTVNCSATDTGGLTADGSFTITVVDTKAPDLGDLPSPSASTTNPSGTTVAWDEPTASDVVDPSPSEDCLPASGSMFPVGTTTVTCTTSDASGNAASGTFDVTVTLDTPPPPPPPPPPPASGMSVSWGEPLGHGWATANLGRALPVKVDIRVDGKHLGPNGGNAAPVLRADRLDRCGHDAVVKGSMALGSLRWTGGRWMTVVDTGRLTGGCWRLVVAVGGTDAGSKGLRLIDGHHACGHDRRGNHAR